MARPRKHDRTAIVRAICKRIAKGAFVKDAAADEGTTADQVRDWVAVDPELSALYARARESQAHAIAEDACSIADGTDRDGQARLEAMVNGVKGADDRDKERLLNALAYSAVQRDRIRVDTRKWMASKIAPRHYGDKLEVSGDPERPVVVQLWEFGGRKVSF